MKLILIGRSGSGKDTLAEILKSFGFSVCKTYATRPRRFEQEDTHYFITEEQYRNFPPDEILAVTKIGPYHYFTAKEDALNSDIIILDPRGFEDIQASLPQESFLAVYVCAQDEIRQKRALKRSKTENWNDRNEKESPQFDAFEEKIGYPASRNRMIRLSDRSSCITLPNNRDLDSLKYKAVSLCHTLHSTR